MGSLCTRLAVLDTSGTTVCEDEAKATAFVESIALFDLGPECPGFDDRVAYMRNARGISVLALFRTLLDDPLQAQQARRALDAAMAASFAQGGVHGRAEMERVHHTHVVDSIADVVPACVPVSVA